MLGNHLPYRCGEHVALYRGCLVGDPGDCLLYRCGERVALRHGRDKHRDPGNRLPYRLGERVFLCRGGDQAGDLGNFLREPDILLPYLRRDRVVLHHSCCSGEPGIIHTRGDTLRGKARTAPPLL